MNGSPLDEVKDYVANTGYVLQLAAPYYEEFTVRCVPTRSYELIDFSLYHCRENITLAAHMKLSNMMTWRQKFERVEQVMEVVSWKKYRMPHPNSTTD